ncbi:MAG: SGNH/GDSL hydrolase family protein, partial [Pseudomonadota bacterium]
MVRMPSGVRIQIHTDSPKLGLHFHATNMVTPPAERRPIVFNLEIPQASGNPIAETSSTQGNTIQLDRSRPGEFELLRGEPDTIWFENLPTDFKTCELWLPHNALIELRTLHIEDGSKIKPLPRDSRPHWIHYGSSISHCMEASAPAYTWPAVAARQAGFTLQSLGVGGQCHLDQFVARTIRDADADLISIKTGINVINMDSMRERVYEPALHGFLDTIREGQPDTLITLISPIYCPSAERHPGPTIPNADGKFVTIPGHEDIRAGCMTLTRVREIITNVVSRRREAGDPNLFYVDGLSLFGESDAHDLPDDLHPNPAGYVRMGERFGEVLADLVDALDLTEAM